MAMAGFWRNKHISNLQIYRVITDQITWQIHASYFTESSRTCQFAARKNCKNCGIV